MGRCTSTSTSTTSVSSRAGTAPSAPPSALSTAGAMLYRSTFFFFKPKNEECKEKRCYFELIWSAIQWDLEEESFPRTLPPVIFSAVGGDAVFRALQPQAQQLPAGVHLHPELQTHRCSGSACLSHSGRFGFPRPSQASGPTEPKSGSSSLGPATIWWVFASARNNANHYKLFENVCFVCVSASKRRSSRPPSALRTAASGGMKAIASPPPYVEPL